MNKAERLQRILAEINKGHFPSVFDLCRLCEKKERTIREDLRYLREFLEFEIIHDSSRGGYYNANPEKELLPVNLSQGELLVLTLGRDMLKEYTGTAFENILKIALDKVKERLPEQVSLDLPDFHGIVKFKKSGVVDIDRAVFFNLNKACNDETVVRILYAAASTGQTTFRDIEPLRLIESRGTWYCVAWCRNAGALRKFALHRILELKMSDEEIPDRDIDIDNYVGEAFLLEHGDDLRTYKVKFDAKSARYVRERKWHQSQKIDNQEDGSCTMEFTATNLHEVMRWVVVFGAGATVLEPKELRTLMRDELKAMLSHYEPSKVTNLPERKRKKEAALSGLDGSAKVKSKKQTDD